MYDYHLETRGQGFDIKSTGDALRTEGKLPSVPSRRSGRLFEESLKQKAHEHAASRKRKHKSRDFQRALRDEPDSGPGESDDIPKPPKSKVSMSDLGGSGDDSGDEDFSTKSAEAGSLSSSGEDVAVGDKRKAAKNVGQHSSKKSVAASPSVSTFHYPRGESDAGSVGSRKKSKGRWKQRAVRKSVPVRSKSSKKQESVVVEDVPPSSSKSKVKGKGRQTIVESDVDLSVGNSEEEDSELDAGAAISSKLFEYDSKLALLLLRNRECHSEKKADVSAFRKLGLDKLLKERSLWSTVVNVGGYEPNIVREFFANFVKDKTSDPQSRKFAKTYVRGSIFDFSPSYINRFLGLADEDLAINTPAAEQEMVSTISGGKLKKWTSRTHASSLTSMYVALYKIAVNNWTPTSNTTLLTREQAEFIYKVGKGLPFNFGAIVVSNIFRAAAKIKASNLIPYPSLIYRLLKDQGYVTPKGAKMEKAGSLLIFDKAMLFSDKRVQDLPYKLPPLSRPASEEPEDVDGDAEEDVDPSSINISVREACLALPLLIQKVEFAVNVLKDLKDVAVSLRRIKAALSPATI